MRMLSRLFRLLERQAQSLGDRPGRRICSSVSCSHLGRFERRVIPCDVTGRILAIFMSKDCPAESRAQSPSQWQNVDVHLSSLLSRRGRSYLPQWMEVYNF